MRVPHVTDYQWIDGKRYISMEDHRRFVASGIDVLLRRGVVLSANTITLKWSTAHEIYYVYDPNGEGETEYNDAVSAWSAFDDAMRTEEKAR